MDNVDEIVALLRKQADLEIQIMNAGGPAVAAEWALATTRRRLVAYPEAPRRGAAYRARFAPLPRHGLGPGCHRL
jgi:hypothetical protein